MSEQAPIDLSADDRLKLAQLRRIKILAAAALGCSFLVFVAARVLAPSVPGMGAVAAFAEAATIGGLADWYAVVVLFRHPLGLRIPHTAIIPANQDRIADNLGLFLERNFLEADVVEQRIGEIDFADAVADMLADEERAESISRFALRAVPDVLRAVEETGFLHFAGEKMRREIDRVEVTPVAVDFLDSFVRDGRYQSLLDDVTTALERVLQDPRTLERVEKRVAAELPTVLYVFQTEGVILRRIVRAVAHMLEDVRDTPDHELRGEFQELFEGYVERMKTSERFHRRVERFKSDLFASREIASLADRMWDSVVHYIEADIEKIDSELATQATRILGGLARRIREDERLRRDINRSVTQAAARAVEERKSEVSVFVSSQVKSWDFRQLVTLIEANVGRDLQFIRFNGMIVGGIAGLALYAFEIAVLPSQWLH